MTSIDNRIYRTLKLSKKFKSGSDDKLSISNVIIHPGASQSSYAGDFYETPMAAFIDAAEKLEELKKSATSEQLDAAKKEATARIEALNAQRDKLAKSYMAGHSFIHPYALLRLAGARPINDTIKFDGDNGYLSSSSVTNVYDIARNISGNSSINLSKWYEDKNSPKGYTKNPTTADLISWGNSDARGRFPYMFQDFVFCKQWNKIENNRLITLRRYPAPVVDSVEPARYDTLNNTQDDSSTNNNANTAVDVKSKMPFAPLVTAVTYFGEGTDNSIKDLLAFSYKYNWKESEGDIFNTSSTQIEEGNVVNTGSNFLDNGLSTLARGLGYISDFKNTQGDKSSSPINPMHALGLPPDPYNSGPYENRIIGPVNVITKTQRRDRGLVFTQESLNITFDYVSRPIANVNNKAILLDLLSNILAMTYSSGTFFGGLHRYRNDNPSVYPWRSTDSLTKLYKGELFGKDGAWRSVTENALSNDNISWISNLTSSLINGVKAMASDVLNAITGKKRSSEEEAENDEAKSTLKKTKDGIMQTAGRAVASKLLKGQTAPYLNNARALLTGEPVGDWHLTIGNPLNPIAVIGNLIVTNSKIEFYDELGPDDFPIGFKATITLSHGMGRDKDAIESMFNKGAGRIYILSDSFKSSADSETTVDAYTGVNNPLKDQFKRDPFKYFLKTTGSDEITDYSNPKLALSESNLVSYPTYVPRLDSAESNTIENANTYLAEPWTMHNIL